MRKNVGTLDKTLRVGVAIIIIGLYFMNVIPGSLKLVFLVLAGIFFLTSLIGFCPFYSIFRVNTSNNLPKPKL